MGHNTHPQKGLLEFHPKRKPSDFNHKTRRGRCFCRDLYVRDFTNPSVAECPFLLSFWARWTVARSSSLVLQLYGFAILHCRLQGSALIPQRLGEVLADADGGNGPPITNTRLANRTDVLRSHRSPVRADAH